MPSQRIASLPNWSIAMQKELAGQDTDRRLPAGGSTEPRPVPAGAMDPAAAGLAAELVNGSRM